MSGKIRPTGVTVMGVLQILTGLASLGLGFMLGASYFILGGLIASGVEGVSFSAGFGGMLLIAAIVGMVLIIVGIASLVIAYGLFKGKNWAWMLCFVFAALGSVFGILAFPAGIITLVFNALIIYYLTRHNVKEYFGRTK